MASATQGPETNIDPEPEWTGGTNLPIAALANGALTLPPELKVGPVTTYRLNKLGLERLVVPHDRDLRAGREYDEVQRVWFTGTIFCWFVLNLQQLCAAIDKPEVFKDAVTTPPDVFSKDYARQLIDFAAPRILRQDFRQLKSLYHQLEPAAQLQDGMNGWKTESEDGDEDRTEVETDGNEGDLELLEDVPVAETYGGIPIWNGIPVAEPCRGIGWRYPQPGELEDPDMLKNWINGSFNRRGE